MLSDDHTPNRHHTRTSTHHTVRAYTIMPASIQLLNSVTGQIGLSKKDTHPPNGVGGRTFFKMVRVSWTNQPSLSDIS